MGGFRVRNVSIGLLSVNSFHLFPFNSHKCDDKNCSNYTIPSIPSYFCQQKLSKDITRRNPPISVLCNRHLLGEWTGYDNITRDDFIEWSEFPQEMYTDVTWKAIRDEIKQRLTWNVYGKMYPQMTPMKHILYLDVDAHLGFLGKEHFNKYDSCRDHLNQRLELKNPPPNHPLIVKYINSCGALGYAKFLNDHGKSVTFDYFELIQNQTVSDNTILSLFSFSQKNITPSHIAAAVRMYRPLLLEHLLSRLDSSSASLIVTSELLSELVSVHKCAPFVTRAIHCYDVINECHILNKCSVPQRKLILIEALKHNNYHLVERLYHENYTHATDLNNIFLITETIEHKVMNQYNLR